MALESSSTGKSAMSSAEEGLDTMEKLMDMFLSMLESKKKTAAQKAMAEWINAGQETHVFNGRGDCLREVAQRFREEGIPYLYINNDLGRDCIIIRDKDTERASIINRETLVRRGNYYQMVSSAEMETIFAKSDAVKNKNLITVENLNKYEAEVLKNKCNWITRGFMVGVDKQKIAGRESYSITTHTNNTYDDSCVANETCMRNDFSKAYLEMTFSLYGPNMDTKIRQIEADMKLNEVLKKSRGTKKELYLCGAEDNTRYMKIDEDGFKYYECSYDSEGKEQAILKAEVGADDFNYDEQIQKYSDQFRDCVFVDDFDMVQAHLATEKVILHTDRPKLTPEQDIISSFESQLARKMDVIIKKHILEIAASGENQLPVRGADAFNRYQEEAAKIIESLAENKIPEGYNHNDIAEIKECFESANKKISKKEMKVSPEKYLRSVEKMRGISTIEHQATDRSSELIHERNYKAKRIVKTEKQPERER